MPKRFDIIGQRFGRLIVLSEAHRDKQNSRMSRCQCDCGKIHIARNGSLRYGSTKSCGCGKVISSREKATTHGMTHSPTWTSWVQMISRTRPNWKEAKYYFDKGIKVCDRWLESFENFLADMGKRPDGTSLGRIDGNKGYDPTNCRWETPTQQNRNACSNRIETVKGITGCVSELVEHFGISHKLTYQRLHLGWSIEKALFHPIRQSKQSMKQSQHPNTKVIQ